MYAVQMLLCDVIVQLHAVFESIVYFISNNHRTALVNAFTIGNGKSEL